MSFYPGCHSGRRADAFNPAISDPAFVIDGRLAGILPYFLPYKYNNAEGLETPQFFMFNGHRKTRICGGFLGD
jgi:hypothetical protein